MISMSELVINEIATTKKGAWLPFLLLQSRQLIIYLKLNWLTEGHLLIHIAFFVVG